MPEKGRAIAVDEVVLDLEDSVPAAGKDEARAGLVEALAHAAIGRRDRSPCGSTGSTRRGFDATSPSSSRGAGAAIDSIVVPKVESADQLRLLDRLLGELEPAGRSDDRSPSRR